MRLPIRTLTLLFSIQLFLFANTASAAVGEVKSTSKIADGTGGLPVDTLVDEDLFGWSVTNLGDLDGDTIADIAVGAIGDNTGGVTRGAVYILFLNADGTVKSQQKIADGTGGLTADTLADLDQFGSSVTNLGDLDGDTITDIAVGASGDDTGGGFSRGALYILFLNANGTVKSQQKIANGTGGLPVDALVDFDQLGWSVTNLGDLDGDTITDIAVGAFGDRTGGFQRGAVYVLFLNANGTVKSQQKIADGTGGLPAETLANDDNFGSSVTNLGDLDGDTITDIAVGARGDDTGDGFNRGALYILFLNANGTVKSQQKIADGTGGLPADTLAVFDEFGWSVTNLGDLDGDTITDIAVGAYADDTGGNGRGAAYLLFLNADGTVKSQQKIADGTGGLPADTLVDGDRFGSSVTNLGDFDGDTITDIAVGAYLDDTGGGARGSVYLLQLKGQSDPDPEPSLSVSGFPSSITLGDAINATFTASDFDGAVTASLTGNVPPGLTLSGNNIIGVPTAAGTYTFALKATDGTDTKTQALTLTVIDGAFVETVTIQRSANTIAFQTYTLDPNGTLSGTATHQVTAGSLPTGFKIRGNELRGQFSNTGTYNFTITSSAGNDQVIHNFTYTVRQPVVTPFVTQVSLNGVPTQTVLITAPSHAVAAEVEPYSATIPAGERVEIAFEFDFIKDPYSWAITAGTLPQGLVLDGTAGILFGTPTETGAFNFTVSVKDWRGRGYLNVNLTVE